jgi:hypothetical protein
MRERAVLRGYRLAGLLVAVILAGAVGACGQSASGPTFTGASGVSCTNYAIHASGRYHDEVSVRVKASNATARTALFAVDVAMTVSRPGRTAAPTAHVTIDGPVPSRSSLELGHKVLTVGPVSHCRVTRVSRS